MKRARKLLVLLFIFTIALSILFLQDRQNLIPNTRMDIPNEVYKTHILGGFSTDTPERAIKAAADGIQVVFKYNDPPSESDRLGQKLQFLHMKVIDGYISSHLYYYECHRTKTV